MEHFQHKNIWFYDDDYPSTLSEVEIIDPLGVICNFFNQYTLTHAKRYLWHSIKYNLVDITAPTKELRPQYHRFLIDTERLVDAAWLLRTSSPNEKLNGPDQFSKDYLKGIRDQDLISLLSQAQISFPLKAVNEFFKYDSLCRWKTCFLERLRKTIVSPSYDLFFDPHSLEEFIKFSKLTKLLEGLFLLLNKYGYDLEHSKHFAHENWCSGKPADLTNWLSEYVKQNDYCISLQHFANICHAHRFHHDWNGYNTYKIFNSYETVLKVTHAVLEVLSNPPSGNLTPAIQKAAKPFKNWSLGRVTSFVSELLLTSRTFSKGYKRYVPPQKEIELVTRLIYLAHEIQR